MEGGQLLYYVSAAHKELYIILSEHDTVETLQQQIEYHLEIPVLNQKIQGWAKEPHGRDSILKNCSDCSSDSINCLEVFYETDINPSILQDEQKNESETPVAAPSQQNMKDKYREFAASKKNENWEQVNNNDNTSNTVDIRKAGPSQEHSVLDTDGNYREIDAYEKDDSWGQVDNNDNSSNTADIRIVGPSQQQTVLDSEGTYREFNVSKKDDNWEQVDNNDNGSNTVDVRKAGPSHEHSVLDTDGNYREMEIKVCIDLVSKNPYWFDLNFRSCLLDMAIYISTQTLENGKILLLYFHNDSSAFSQMFLKNIQNEKLKQLLNRSYFCLGWDISDETYHCALRNALEKHVILAPFADLITKKSACALCIVPIADTLSVFACITGDISIKDFLKHLEDIESKFMEAIETENSVLEIELQHQNTLNDDFTYERFQLMMADGLGDRDYDSFEYDEHEHLKNKIGFALKGPPTDINGYNEKDKKIIEKLFQIILTENNNIAEYQDKIEIAFIYNCTTPLPKEKIAREKKYDDYNPNTDINPMPIYVLRKCRGCENPCRVFIDESGRVYNSWRDYLLKNKLHECEMILPLNGRYEVREKKVLLEKHLSPACHLDTKALQVGDTTSTVAGLVSGGVFIAAAIPAIAVAPALLITGGVVGAIAGLWGVGRSIHNLVDRSHHKESIHFANSEARGAYLNIVAGSLGFVGAGANMAVSQLAVRGYNIGKGAGAAVNTIGVLNIGASGASVVNSGYDAISQWLNENKAPSALTIVQLSSSILFFGHAVYSFKSASVIAEEGQTKVLKDYNDSLRSNRHRKTFNRLLNETIKKEGCAVKGRAEVISTIRNIPNKDDVFAALTRNTKRMSKNGIKYSAEGGQIQLNSITINIKEFMGLNKNQAESFLLNLTEQTPTTSLSRPSIGFTNSIKNILTDVHVDFSGANFDNILMYGQKLLLFCSLDIRNMVLEALHVVLPKLSIPIVKLLDEILPKNRLVTEILGIGLKFFSKLADDLEAKYQLYKRTKDRKYYSPIFDKVNVEYAKRIIQFFEKVVRNCFSGRTLTAWAIKEMSEFIATWISKTVYDYNKDQERKAKRQTHSAKSKPRTRVDCQICGGYYFVP